MCAHTHVRLVCGAPLSCVCVFVWRCAIGYVVCERSQMGLKSFYLAVNCHFFFAGLRPAHPAGGHGAPQTPRVRPCSASRSPKRQVRLSAEVTSGRPTSKKTAMYPARVRGSGPGLGLGLRLWLRLRGRGWSGSSVRAAVYQCRLEAPAAHRPCTPACARVRIATVRSLRAIGARRAAAACWQHSGTATRSTRAPGGRFTRPVLGGRGPPHGLVKSSFGTRLGTGLAS